MIYLLFLFNCYYSYLSKHFLQKVIAHEHEIGFEEDQEIFEDDFPQIEVKNIKIIRTLTHNNIQCFGPKAFQDTSIIPKSKNTLFL